MTASIFDIFCADEPEEEKPSKAKGRRARIAKGQVASLVELLKEAHPNPVSGAVIQEKLGIKNVNGRVHDARREGWDIAGDDDLPLAPDNTQLYRLRTHTQGEGEGAPDGALRVVVRRGRPTVKGYSDVSDTVLQAILEREVEDTVRRVVAAYRARGGGLR